MKCEVCNVFSATGVDYRGFDTLQKLQVCPFCAKLNDVSVYRIQREGINPLELYEELHYDKMSNTMLSEVFDYFYENVGDSDALNSLLEVHREVTLREESV